MHKNTSKYNLMIIAAQWNRIGNQSPSLRIINYNTTNTLILLTNMHLYVLNNMLKFKHMHTWN